MIRRICLAIGLAALCLDASAKPKPLPMPLAQELAVEVVMGQHELAVDVPATASAMGMQFGLVGAIIGSAVQNSQVKKAEERIVPIRDQLLAYRFDERVEAVLRARLASEGLSPNPSINVMQSPWDAADAQRNGQDMPLHAMVLTPRYSMDTGFGTLSVSLMTQVVDRTIKPNGKVKTKYRFTRTYAFRYPLMGAAGEDNPQRWAGMGSQRLAELLDEGITQAVDMLVHDFSPAGRGEWAQKIKRQSTTVKGMSFPGLAVRQTPDWAWVRTGNAMAIATLQGYQPIDFAAASATPVVAAEAATQTAAAAPVTTAMATGAATPADPMIAATAEQTDLSAQAVSAESSSTAAVPAASAETPSATSAPAAQADEH
jgi:hypothetical protein